MHYKLTLVNEVPGLNVKSWNFTVPATIGREPGIEVCIDHESISRKHCQFTNNVQEALVIKDLHSLNGTYVNDARIDQKVLSPGEVIQIGALRMEITFCTEQEHTAAKKASKPQGSVYATQPMPSYRPASAPKEPWWKRLLRF